MSNAQYAAGLFSEITWVLLGLISRNLKRTSADISQLAQLPLPQWAACVGIGAASLIVRWALLIVPTPTPSDGQGQKRD